MNPSIARRAAHLGRISLLALAALAGPLGTAALADTDKPITVYASQFRTQRINWKPSAPAAPSNPFAPRGPGCASVTSSVANQFNSIDVGSEITLQAGMVQGEGFGSTYTVPDPVPGTTNVNEAFPIEVNLVEFIAGTAATLSGSDGANVRLGWSIELWDGEPYVGTSSIVFSVVSDPDPTSGLPGDLALQRVSGTLCSDISVLLGGSPASVGKVQFSVDQTADAADRMIVPGNATDTLGNHLNTFTVVVRIEHHNVPGATTCSNVDICNNAFLATEGQSNALNNPTKNWLVAVACPNGAPAGYTRFNNLSTSFRPTRDVLQQVTYTPAFCVGVPSGACCATAGTCTVVTQAACTGTSTYRGDSTTCNPNLCPQPPVTGACCFGTGCLTASSTDCSGGGGTFQGAASTCNASACPTGACCIVNTGACSTATPAACSTSGGAYRGTGIACNTTICPPPTGACCASNNFCLSAQTQSACTNAGLTWRGGGTVCSPNPCVPTTGLCCRGTTCVTGIAQAGCTASGTVGAAYAAGTTACNTSGNGASPCCYADFNKQSGISVQDIFDYLNAWLAASPYCKIAGDGVSTPVVQDIFDYLNLWLAGGC